MPRCRILVTGRVQGVGFRWFATRAADRCGITGFVRNEPDGSVCCEAQGDPQQLAAFLAALQQGPPGSHVMHVDTTAIAEQDETSFAIRR